MNYSYKNTIELFNKINKVIYGVEPFKDNQDSERHDPEDLTPEELQEKSDKAREI